MKTTQKIKLKEVVFIQVIGGKFKGLKLESGKNEFLRPTKDRIKESIFDILQFKIINKNFIDVFGGTGQVGIEALSRGAKGVTILEMNKESADLIRKNISKLKSTKNIKMINTDAKKYLQSTVQNFDIAFLDPPYKDINLLNETLELISEKMAENGIIITETLANYNAPEKIKNFSLQKRYKYGNITLNIYNSI